jgi:hypothetical protein
MKNGQLRNGLPHWLSSSCNVSRCPFAVTIPCWWYQLVYHRRIHWYALMFVPKQRNGKQPRSTNTKTRIPTAPCMHIFVYVQTVCMYIYIVIYINVQYYTHIEETNVIIDIWTHQPQSGGWTSPASTRTQMFGRFSRVSSSFVRRCTHNTPLFNLHDHFICHKCKKRQPQNEYK